MKKDWLSKFHPPRIILYPGSGKDFQPILQYWDLFDYFLFVDIEEVGKLWNITFQQALRKYSTKNNIELSCLPIDKPTLASQMNLCEKKTFCYRIKRHSAERDLIYCKTDYRDILKSLNTHSISISGLILRGATAGEGGSGFMPDCVADNAPNNQILKNILSTPFLAEGMMCDSRPPTWCKRILGWKIHSMNLFIKR